MKRRLYSFLVLGFLTTLSACKDEDPPLPDNLLQFEAPAIGFEAQAGEVEVKVLLSRAADAAVPITLALQSSGLTYGTEFTTDPAASNGSISLTVPAGSSEAVLKVKKVAGVLLLDGDEEITFTVSAASPAVVLSGNTTTTLRFSEILSESAAMVLNGGGAAFTNKVFIDLSANRQTAIARTAWDLAFYSGNEFRVVLNNETGALAVALDKTDLNQVTAQDTVALVAKLTLDTYSPEAMQYIDDVEGDLTKTAIASVATTDSENKVYIVNRGTKGATARGWQKIRVLRSSNGYKLQYADIKATTYKELTITKDSNLNFSYVSFATGAVAVEPAKDRWDIAWTAYTYKLGPIPYYFQDMVLLNHLGGASVAKVQTSMVSYEAFGEANLSALEFQTNKLAIGSDWRFTTGAGAPNVHTDRFYVVKDADGNIYKLRFTSMAQNGERGKPQIEYRLVKKAS
ncbi:HmuY family protein [Pontibacter sp. 13R65]|uniref:HmuY family protein n=1 Tax=Pontibacter sp. 13R65 TaxID=3127458 RepID=UPI00301C1739